MAGVVNRVERWVYDRVKDHPVLKQRIVDAYQAALGLAPQAPIRTRLHPVVRPGFFFGFHDKTSFSPDGEHLLAHRNLLGDRPVSAGDGVEVGCFTGADWREFRPLARTTAWNWQLGSMLQWVGPESDRVAFNALDDGHPIAKVLTIDGTVREIWPHPVVHVSPAGTQACTYDFFRVEEAMPGYGVVHDRSSRRDGAGAPFRVFDCGSGRTTFSITLEEAAAIAPQPSMRSAFHYFHHALFSPDGRRVFFLHRWVDGNQRRWTRMFSVDPDGDDLYLFPMDEMVSHVTWASPTHVFGYLRYPGEGDGYYLLEDRTGRATRYFGGVLDSDGHPTMDRPRNIVVTDTYPDRFRNQRLLLLRLDASAPVELCRTHLPRRFNRELQVDLHPRLHPSRDVICFDSGHTGTRALVTLDFSAAV